MWIYIKQLGSILPLLRTNHVATVRTPEGLIGVHRQFQEVDCHVYTGQWSGEPVNHALGRAEDGCQL